MYWGHGAYGVAEASAAYFRKQPSELRAAEAAMLAALLPCPEGFSPFEDRETAAVRMGYVSPASNALESALRLFPSYSVLPMSIIIIVVIIIIIIIIIITIPIPIATTAFIERHNISHHPPGPPFHHPFLSHCITVLLFPLSLVLTPVG